MSGQTWWVVAIVAVVIAGVIGFFVGRQSGGAKQRIEELEGALQRQKDEITGYKREVESHFDRTATLFVSMAGSYKELFEHLSSGYERLSAGGARDVFKERVTALLLDGPARKSGGEGVVLDHSDEKASGAAANQDDDAQQAERELAAVATPAQPEPSAAENAQEGQAGPGGAEADKSAEGEASPERSAATPGFAVPDRAEQEEPTDREPTLRKEAGEQGALEQESAGQEPSADRAYSGAQEPDATADEAVRREAGAEAVPAQTTDSKT